MQRAALEVSTFKFAKAYDWWTQRRAYEERGRLDEALTWRRYFATFERRLKMLAAKAKKQADLGLELVDARRRQSFIAAVTRLNEELAASRPAPAYAWDPDPWPRLTDRQGSGSSSQELDLGQIPSVGAVICRLRMLEVIGVAPDGWLDVELLREYATGPWVEGTQIASGRSRPYGEDGLLPLLPSQIQIARGLTV